MHHLTSSTIPSLLDDKKIDAVVGLDARGFLLGPIIALRLGAAFVPVRKKGKLPGKTVEVEYAKEYGAVSFSSSTCCECASDRLGSRVEHTGLVSDTDRSHQARSERGCRR